MGVPTEHSQDSGRSGELGGRDVRTIRDSWPPGNGGSLHVTNCCFIPVPWSSPTDPTPTSSTESPPNTQRVFPFRGGGVPADLKGGVCDMMEASLRWRKLDPERSTDSTGFRQDLRAVVSAEGRLGGSSHFLGRVPD